MARIMGAVGDMKAVAAIGELLARERRTRLAAERRLVSMQAELMRANDALDAHARHLAGQIGPLRREAEALRSLAGQEEGQRRAAERRLWSALEAIPDGFAVYDAGLVLVAANRRYLRAFQGLDEMRAGIGYRRVLELAAHEGIVDIGMMRPERWVDAMASRLDERRPEPQTLRLWNGVCLRVTHRRAASGDLVVLARDVTEVMEREAELEEARHKAEAASRAKSAFLANMSHELRTPVGGILGMAQLLAEEELGADQRAQVEVIQASGEALLTIVDDVLDLGRIEARDLSLRPAAFDLRAVLREALDSVRPVALERGLAVECDVDAALPERVVGDAGRVRQVLANIVGNAIKFTPSGRVTVRVVGAGWPAPGVVRVHVSVEDTGIGIEPAELERVFGAFEQLESGHARSHDGAGLGLAITRRLVALMGGEVWAESMPGEGSCFGFRIDLPIAQAPRSPAAGPSGAGSAGGAGDVLGGDPARAVPGSPVEATPGGDGPPTPTAPDGRGAEEHRSAAARGTDGPASAEPSSRGRDDGAIGGGGRAAAPSTSGPAPSDDPPAATGDAGPRAMRVLAAEDNRANSMILRRMLKGLDLELTVVGDGAEAVAATARLAPDLILMDISMPGTDGREATRLIRGAEAASGASRVPIVAMTAHALPGDEEAILAAGLDAYLPKPLRKAVLHEVIASHAPAGVRPPIPS